METHDIDSDVLLILFLLRFAIGLFVLVLFLVLNGSPYLFSCSCRQKKQ